jgi:hypothetical protein
MSDHEALSSTVGQTRTSASAPLTTRNVYLKSHSQVCGHGADTKNIRTWELR